jgi:hypothetical protein
VVVYPSLYGHLLNRLPFDTGSRANLIALLAASGEVTDLNLTECEEYFDLSGVPLFRMHKVNAEQFQQHPSHFLVPMGPWRKYAEIMTVIKVRGSLPQFLSHGKERWNLQLEGEHSTLEVEEYMTAQGITQAPFILYRALLIKKITGTLGVAGAFALSTAELYNRYFGQSFPLAQAMHASYVQHVARYGGSLLDLSRIVNEPRYLADRFHIENWQEFHEGVVTWHETNLDLMLAHGFTEFETLRVL